MQSREEESAGGNRENRLWWRAGCMGGLRGCCRKERMPWQVHCLAPSKDYDKCWLLLCSGATICAQQTRGKKKGRGCLKTSESTCAATMCWQKQLRQFRERPAGNTAFLLLALKLEITVDAPQFIVKHVVVVVGFQDLHSMNF